MLRIRYNHESSNYFLDNGELTRDLMIAIEGLFFSNGVPTEGEHFELPDQHYVWRMLGHVVVYDIAGDVLTIRHVMPAV